MTYLFNNCRNRDHTRYGAGAFYDLDLGGYQATMAKGLRPGDCCIVASYGEGLVIFDWYAFAHEKRMFGEGGELVRVLFGRRRGSESLGRPRAAATVPYARLFDCHGRFKVAAVLRLEETATPLGAIMPGR